MRFELALRAHHHRNAMWERCAWMRRALRIESVRIGAIVAMNCDVIGADVNTDEALVFPFGLCEDANGALGNDALGLVGSSVCGFPPLPAVDVTEDESVWAEDRVKKEALEKCASEACVRSCALMIEVGAVAGFWF